MDTSLLFKELQSKQDFSETDLQKLIPFFEKQTFKKNELIFQPGDVVRKTFFIQKGIFHQYYLNSEGNERTIYFVDEGNFAGELMSFLHKTPTQFFFQALEDSEALFMNRENW